MERQGGAREPSDDLVLVGELSKLTPSAPPSASTAAAATSPPTPERGAASSAPASPDTPLGTVTPPRSQRRFRRPQPRRPGGSDGQLVRVYPASAERDLGGRPVGPAPRLGHRSGEPGDRRHPTEPRNVTFTDFCPAPPRALCHTLDVVVRPVSGNETSISVRCQVVLRGAAHLLGRRSGKVLATPESSVEQDCPDAISRLL